ncbi:MAG: T9SS type A sorting domain-containing protein [Candidatus Kapaibacteriota bacterium]
MKYRLCITSFFAVIALFAMQDKAIAQFTQPYLMKEGLTAMKKAVADSGWKKPVLTTIVTIGDTTGLGQAGALLGNGFDMKTGRSTLWVYVISIEDAAGNPATKLLAYIKVPIIGMQQVPLPADAVPGDVPFQPQDSIPAASVLNSDAIVGKVAANVDYQSFIKENPKAKSSFIVLFTSPIEFPGTPFQAGAPLWNFNFADPADTLAPSLTCFTHAVTGETVCFGSEPTSVKEELASNDELSMLIHPIPQGMNGTILISSQCAAHSSLEITDLMGRTVYSQSHIESSQLTLPVLPSGVYMARLQHPHGISSLRFIQQ